jgi:transcription initiation factor TFIID subunit 12
VAKKRTWFCISSENWLAVAKNLAKQTAKQPSSQAANMSSPGDGSPSQINKSPTGGKGGKSLQRLMAQQQEQQPPQPVPAEAVVAVAPPQPSPLGRPKGKDFSAMAARAPPRPSEPLDAPAPPQQQSASSPLSAKPKGKDFSAMASRMGGGPTADVHVRQPHPASEVEKARAAHLQAEARQAAGMPPLERPTATSVTTEPPMIPLPKVGMGQQRSLSLSHNNNNNNYYYPATGGPPPVFATTGGVGYPTPDPMRMSHPTAPRRSSLSSSPAMHGSSSSRMPTTALSTAPIATASRHPTPQPTALESRLSSTAAAAPHMAPLIGPRLGDLVRTLDPNYTLDCQAEQQLLQLADDFLDKVVRQSLRLAQHRNSKTVDVQDLQLVLAKQWGIVIPGLGPPVQRKPKNSGEAAGRSGTPTNASSSSNKRKATGSAVASGGAAAKSSSSNKSSKTTQGVAVATQL